MSRSYYHNPFMGITGRSSCKWWRSSENRRYRAYAKNLIRHERYDDIQDFCGRFGNEWSSPRDGIQYFGGMKHRECISMDDLEPFTWRWWLSERCWVEKNIHFCHKEYTRLLRK
jgi:hypothetical protein